MKVYLIGSGGREHAIARGLVRSPQLTELICAPGNPGIAQLPKTRCVPIASDNVIAHLEYLERNRVDLVVPGPEAPICEGIANMCRRIDIPTCAPSVYAAKLEGSKLFAKQFMTAWGIPTAPWTYASGEQEVLAAIQRLGGLPIVLKADGLCAGKGVFVCTNEKKLVEALHHLVHAKTFGSASDIIIVEKCLSGIEVSYMCLTDGKITVFFPEACDYKRLSNDTDSPNTGGMAAHSPSDIFDVAQYKRKMERILLHVVESMELEGTPFVGILYGGFMLTDNGPQVLEFNVRFGDPEAQVIIPRLEEDLLELLFRAATKSIVRHSLAISSDACACLVVASEGYPDAPVMGRSISGIDSAEQIPNAWVDHAGTKMDNRGLISSGGRVLDVCARDVDVRSAIERAEKAARIIQLEGKQIRTNLRGTNT